MELNNIILFILILLIIKFCICKKCQKCNNKINNIVNYDNNEILQKDKFNYSTIIEQEIGNNKFRQILPPNFAEPDIKKSRIRYGKIMNF